MPRTVPEIWQFARPVLSGMEAMAERCEALGFDGLSLTDSQNLAPDTYVSLTVAARATDRIALGPGVTNPLTRHASVAAGAIATLQHVSNGRAVLGIGRGDSALFNIGHKPAAPRAFEAYVSDLQSYLRGDTLTLGGYPSRLHWLEPERLAKVPVEVAATGPKVIAIGARHAERLSFAVGADLERVRWALGHARASLPAGASPPSYGLYLNVCVDDDRQRAAELVRPGVGVFAHFTGMEGASRDRVEGGDHAVYDALGRDYDKPRHGRADAAHLEALPLEFVSRFAVIGPAEECIARLRAFLDAGIERLLIIGPRPDQFGPAADAALERFAHEVLPALREG
jgi:5,10-methylenetetrahydromethanopterin reductase